MVRLAEEVACQFLFANNLKKAMDSYNKEKYSFDYWNGAKDEHCKAMPQMLGNGFGVVLIGLLSHGKGHSDRPMDLSMDAIRPLDGLHRTMPIETFLGLALEWLDSHDTYKAVIDGANVALYQQNFVDGEFSLLQLNAVVTELKERFQGKWPLVVLHRKRYCKLMENPSNRQLLETWCGAGAIYTTPVGSNDDWYWLYAAVKLKSLLVTNDEMRDHIYELLGSNFFPKWKERHQVKYTFLHGRLVLKMPPPYSLFIQESERGSWHVPLCDNNQDETSRIWLCITRQELTTDSLMENGGIMKKTLQAHDETTAGSIAGKRKERSP
ncbi:hypothetical protein HPP92_002402 [Vanilla planifolia]|uniref:ribonuclease P n=1 Tax=Vanilla planifolia TaxID=51239 RepID=A0A835VIH0_VANPL|nr:hypothetical protein HPP92_002402 [Vanilla planifolia]